MEDSRPRSGENGAAPDRNGVGCPEFEVVSPSGAAVLPRPTRGMVITRDHVVGFAACAALVALAYWFVQKCKD